jgi:hypothetical protein
MQPRSFDAIARALAAPRSRRHLLRVLASGGAAALLGTRRPDTVAALPVCSPPCDRQNCEFCDSQVGACVWRCSATQVCQAGTCVPAPPPQPCNPPCPSTHVCRDGVCVCNGPVCGVPGQGGYGCCPGGYCSGDACCWGTDDVATCAIP